MVGHFNQVTSILFRFPSKENTLNHVRFQFASKRVQSIRWKVFSIINYVFLFKKTTFPQFFFCPTTNSWDEPKKKEPKKKQPKKEKKRKRIQWFLCIIIIFFLRVGCSSFPVGSADATDRHLSTGRIPGIWGIRGIRGILSSIRGIPGGTNGRVRTGRRPLVSASLSGTSVTSWSVRESLASCRASPAERIAAVRADSSPFSFAEKKNETKHEKWPLFLSRPFGHPLRNPWHPPFGARRRNRFFFIFLFFWIHFLSRK